MSGKSSKSSKSSSKVVASIGESEEPSQAGKLAGAKVAKEVAELKATASIGAPQKDEQASKDDKKEAEAYDPDKYELRDDELPQDTPASIILGKLMYKLHTSMHLLYAVFSAYFVGWMGWHLSWAIAIFLIACGAEQVFAEKRWLYNFRKWLRDEHVRKSIAADKEEVVWLNTILEKFFPIYSPEISDQIESAAIKAIDDNLKEPPSGVTHISIAEVNLGVLPPTLHSMKTLNLPGNRYQLDCTLKYHGDLKIVLVVGVGSKLMDFDLPIELRNLSLEGRLRISIKMRSKPPLTKTLKVCFKQPPSIDFELEPGRAFDINSIPGLGNFIRSAIVDSIGAFMVYPVEIPIELGELPPEGWEDDDEEKAKDEDKIEYCGTLRLKVISAKNIRAADMGLRGRSSDPYVKIVCGEHKFKTPVVTRSLNPEWNYACDLLVDKRPDHQLLVFEVKDEDKIGKNVTLGTCKYQFSELVSDESHPAVKKVLMLEGEAATGELVIECAYISGD